MAESTLEYRIWQRGKEWHWQVMSRHQVVASGIADSSAAARIAAFQFSLQSSDNDPEPT